ncbi:MAG: voltage-gated potassium channel [Frankiaceae bacterium]|nr:voltage-gated potassium channel [Frankiaceae bacterium]
MDRTSPAWREVAYQRVEAALNFPLLLLSIALLPLIIWPTFDTSLSSSTRHLLGAIDYAIWAVFVAEYLVKLFLAPSRWRFVRTHLFELMLVVFPMLRPLRIVRSARALRFLGLARLAAAGGSGAKEALASQSSRTATYAVLLAGLLLLVASAVVLDAERTAPGSNIRGFGDALWWGVVTISSVGYGDHYPVTAAGRAIASVVMLFGVGLVSVTTAAFAAWLVKQEEQVEDARVAQLSEQVAGLSAQIAALTAHLVPAQAGPVTDVRAAKIEGGS